MGSVDEQAPSVQDAASGPSRVPGFVLGAGLAPAVVPYSTSWPDYQGNYGGAPVGPVVVDPGTISVNLPHFDHDHK